MDENLPALIEDNESAIEQAIEARLPAVLTTDRDELISTVRKDYKEILQALMDSAKGIWVEKIVEPKDAQGIPTGVKFSARVYQKDPNTDVGQYLLNQVVGKPKETQIMEGRVTFVRDI